jgi:hypothetical protein
MAEAVALETETRVKYHVGTMTSAGRAARRRDRRERRVLLVRHQRPDADHLRYLRDDAASFLGTYVQRGIMASDPFVSIDREGVGELMRIGVERGRKTRPKLKVGICGEHGGDPASVVLPRAGSIMSVSPFRVPIARPPPHRPRSARRRPGRREFSPTPEQHHRDCRHVGDDHQGRKIDQQERQHAAMIKSRASGTRPARQRD